MRGCNIGEALSVYLECVGWRCQAGGRRVLWRKHATHCGSLVLLQQNFKGQFGLLWRLCSLYFSCSSFNLLSAPALASMPALRSPLRYTLPLRSAAPFFGSARSANEVLQQNSALENACVWYNVSMSRMHPLLHLSVRREQSSVSACRPRPQSQRMPEARRRGTSYCFRIRRCLPHSCLQRRLG